MITIITVYKSNNYGSFLQAKVLGDVLSKYDTVQYLNFGQRKWIDLHFLASLRRNMTKGFSIRKFVFVINLFVQNFKMWRTLNVVPKKVIDDRDICVLGSDEIWNLSRSNCKNPIFWGCGINGKKISYAPSINNCSLEEISKHPITDYLQDVSYISVRDDYSKEVLSHFTEKEINIALDPTLLMDVEYYEKFAVYKKLPFKYIALYIFPGGDDSYRKIITNFAKEHDCKIVSIGTYLSWCDVNITAKECANPFLYYIDADYVFANTFHGTAFAINFEKQFFSFAISKKIANLLEQFDLLCRNMDKQMLSPELLNNVASNKIDYTIVNEKKKLLRKRSIDFLAKAVEYIRGEPV